MEQKSLSVTVHNPNSRRGQLPYLVSDDSLKGSVCQVAAYLVVSDEGLEDLERDDMKKDVSVGADCIDWGVLPCLEPIAIEQVVGLQRQWLSQFVSKY